MSAKPEVRPPWPDEIWRVQFFLPSAFLFDEAPFLLVAVSGRVERLVGVAALTLRRSDQSPTSWLYLRVESENPASVDLLQGALAEAWRHGVESVHFGQTIDESSPAAATLREAGFETSAVHEVYEVPSAEMGGRLQRIYEKMLSRRLIPDDVQLMTIQPTLIAKVRDFLFEEMPGSASAMALETAGYKAEHSFALLQNGAVKGVVLSRRAGPVAHVGLRVVAKELRGGLAWANLLLLHASMASGLRTGLQVSRFEFNPNQHLDTRQFAQLHGAKLVGRRLLFKIDNPHKSH